MYTELKDFPGYWISHTPPKLLRERGTLFIECSQTPNSSKDNYWSVTLKDKSGKYIKRSMHRLLMETFVPNPDNKAHVNHIDGNKSNNNLSNLEWATPAENAQHAFATGLSSTSWALKEVHQYSLAGLYIASYSNDTSAEEATGIPKQNISKVTLGKRDHAGYFKWSRELKERIPPSTKKYVKGYMYDNTFYSTLTDLAKLFKLSQPEKASIKRFKKSMQKLIEVIYYD